MMKVEMTCILCPMGCALQVEQRQGAVMVSGNGCKRGERYGEQELLRPMRVVTASVRIDGAVLPLCPVKTRGEVPKSKIPEVLRAVRKARARAPVRVGQVLIENVAGTGVDIVATANRLFA